MKPEQTRSEVAPSTAHLAGRIPIVDVAVHAP